jgi:hypothetical protein
MKNVLKHEHYLMSWFIGVFIFISAGLFVIPEVVSGEDNKPAAVIDGTLNIKEGQTVYLDGTLSSDPGGANLDYSWTLLSSPEGSIAMLGPSGPQVSFELI